MSEEILIDFEALDIPAADPGKAPMKTNIYRLMSQSNTELLPLFPYDGPGDMLPCGSSKRGGKEYGYFLHYNTVDEVALVWAAHGGRGRTGTVRVGLATHGVSGLSADNPEEFTLICITQRQAEHGRQMEAIAFQCGKCATEIYRHSYEARTPKTTQGNEALYFPAPGPILGGATAAAHYNALESRRTCPSCGQVNPPFPVDKWGWADYVARNSISEEARHAIDEVVS